MARRTRIIGTALRVFVGLCAAIVLATAIVPSAAAQAISTLSPAERAALEAQKAALFARMLKNPADLDVDFNYADVSAKLGDYEAAISALERMLLFNPNLPRVDLELGALYFRLGSFAVAQSYFDKAAAAKPPQPVAQRIQQYQKAIVEEKSPNQLSGYVFFGAEYQSDANVAPGSALIHSPIGDVLLDSQFVKKADGNLFATGSLLYDYDLGLQNRDSIEVTGTGFADHYFSVGRLDLDLAEVTAGPRLNFPDLGLGGLHSISIKPYAILNEVGLGESQYFDTYGTGFEADATVLHDLTLKSIFEFRQKNFSNSTNYPIARGLNGNDKLVSIVATKPVTSNSAVSLQFDFLDQSTRFDYYANKDYAVSGGYRIRYKDPTGLRPFPWETTAFVSRAYDNYAAPDPCCNTSGSDLYFSPSDRYDRRWRFGISQTFEITDNAAIVVQIERDIVSSNLSLYGYTSDSVLVGPQIRF